MKKHDEGIAAEKTNITSSHKKMFGPTGPTKEEMVSYYTQVAQRMFPYINNRILSIVRCPEGVGSSCFYQRHPGSSGKNVISLYVPGNNGQPEEYFYLDNATGLISEARMDTIEFHVWESCVDSLEKPDLMTFDLDPDEGLDLNAVRQGVRDLKGILDEFTLTAFLKTSGGKGYHVAVPLKPGVSWDTLHRFARHIAHIMEQRWPDRYTANMRKTERKGKIFIDWLRNARAATTVAPYSLRARNEAPVAMPIAWDELNEVAPGDIHLSEALARLTGDDPWKDFFQVSQTLKEEDMAGL